MPSLLTLLLFCDFLEHRVHTSNLVLFRRMLSDFFIGSERTLEGFIRLGASVVAIAPMERTRQRHRQEAARLLTQQQQMVEDSKQQSQLCVFQYLSARVVTRNIFWLRDMFHEFCNGGDTLVCEFVRQGNEVISVIPVDIQALQANLLQSVELPSVSEFQAESTFGGRGGKLEHKQLQDSVSEFKEGDDDADSDNDEDEIATLAELALMASRPPTPKQLRACIMEALGRLEEQEPWKQVFNPDTLPLPFSEVKWPQLAAALKTFWAENGRAVWERRFWGPLSKLPARRHHSSRKARQAKARESFTTFMTQVYEELGASFFVRMDQRTRRHKGWWYCEPTEDLVSIAQHLGLAACIDYMETQARKRFPAVPAHDIHPIKPNICKSKSMWAATSMMSWILREICAIKDANARVENKKKK